MSDKVIMIGYYGMKDSAGRCVGHTVKVTNEYAKLIAGFTEVELYAVPCIVSSGVDKDLFSQIHLLKNDIEIEGNSLSKRITDKFKIIKNIRQALDNKGILFVYQIDYIFLLYMLLFYRKKKDRRVVALSYHKIFGDKLMNACIKKLDGIIYTQEDMSIEHKNSMWMPDYIYDEDIYGKYNCLPKENKCVCLGTMNRYKQLEKLLNMWKEIDIPLIIAGRFDDKERYYRLKENAPQNVEIRDEVLEYDEYLEMLGSVRFSILPYDMSQYTNRTSGVLLESIYCGSIPIAPEQLLT